MTAWKVISILLSCVLFTIAMLFPSSTPAFPHMLFEHLMLSILQLQFC